MAEATRYLPRSLSAKGYLVPSPPAAYAIRFGVAVSAAIWLGHAPGLVESHSTWILITVLMLVQPTTGASLQKAVHRAVGTLVAAFTAIALFGLFAQNPPLLMAGLFLTQAIGAYGYAGTRFQYAWFVFAFTTAIVLGDAMAGQGEVESVAFERASMVGIGVLLVFVTDSLVWPTRAEPRLREVLAERAQLMGRSLRDLIAFSTDSRVAASAASDPGPSPLASQLELVAGARSELGVSRSSLDALNRVAILLETLASRERVLATPIEMPSLLDAEARSLSTALGELANRVEAAIGEVAAAVKASRAPVPFSDDLANALLALEQVGERLVERNGRIAALDGRTAGFDDLVALLHELEAALSSPQASLVERRSGSDWSFALDPMRTKIALRSGTAVVAAILVPISLGWPINTMVAPIAFMTAVLTRGAAVQTLSALAKVMVLAWVVTDLSIVYIAPHLGRMPLALMAPFTVAVAFAYIGATRPMLAPLPSLGGLVIFLSVFGGTSKPTDVFGAYNTLCYIALALAIGTLFGRLMWPATAAGLFRERVATQLELCLEAIRAPADSEQVDHGRNPTQLVQAFAAHSAQLGVLHRQALHEPVERALDPARRTRILSLLTNLMDAVVVYRPGSLESLLDRGGERMRPLLAAIRRVDGELYESMQAAVVNLRGEASHRASRLAEAHQELVERLDELRADPGSLPGFSEEEKRRSLILIDSRRRLVLRQHALDTWLEDWREAGAGRA
jgi:uncharacterized membrane protein YccC